MKQALIVILTVLLVISACNTKTDIEKNNTKENVVSSKNIDNKNVYEDFLIYFQKNTGNSINIDALIKKYVESTSNINKISYTTEKIKFSSTLQDDLLIKIDMLHVCDRRYIIGIFNHNNEEVFSQEGLALSYEMAEVLNDGKQQLILFTDNSGNGHTLQNMQIILYDEKTQDTAVIFDEVYCAYKYLPFKKIKESNFYSISFENEYEFSLNSIGPKKIVWRSEIFETEDKILLTGTSTFKFDGNKYVSANYYDYRAKAEEIYNLKE